MRGLLVPQKSRDRLTTDFGEGLLSECGQSDRDLNRTSNEFATDVGRGTSNRVQKLSDSAAVTVESVCRSITSSAIVSVPEPLQNETDDPTASIGPPVRSLVAHRWFWSVWLVATAVAVWLEVGRLISLKENSAGIARWIFYWDRETTAAAVLLMLLPLLVAHQKWFRRRAIRPPVELPVSSSKTITKVVWCVLLFGLSISSSWIVGSRSVDLLMSVGAGSKRFDQLPPAYHDEYSYLLQAETFAAGRLTWPAAPIRPDLFHQFHVLNEPKTVSRYFPWTGVWLAVTEPLPNRYWGHWLAGALATVFFFLSLETIAEIKSAVVGGLLIAVSPGLAVFSNMLLAHHPTMLALSVFLYAFLLMIQKPNMGRATVAGLGLTLAMLGRPMTAAGFALPFGIWLGVMLLRGRVNWKLTMGFLVPLGVGFLTLAMLNHAATGSYFRSAYQQYTDTFTPRHRYGFGNGLEATPTDIPAALQAYDRWAQNLTPAVAVENIGRRLIASLQWSLAVFPIAFFGLTAISLLLQPGSNMLRPAHGFASGRTMFGLMAAAVATLHLVHVPYWYAGIMDWHYVFETAPLLLMLTGCGVVYAVRVLRHYVRRRIAVGWCVLFVAVSLFPGWFSGGPFDETSKVESAVQQLGFSRVRFDYFNSVTDSSQIQKPALILVEEEGADPQLSFIINDPDYDSEVLVCRHPMKMEQVQQLAEFFSDRTLYSFDPQLKRYPIFQPIERSIEADDEETSSAIER